MKVTVFVNWSENCILTEKDFEKEIEAETLERFDDSDFFDEHTVTDTKNTADKKQKWFCWKSMKR